MAYNLALLRKERDWVAEQIALPYSESQLEMEYWYTDNTETLNMLQKTCGTTYCVAGHIAACTPGVEWNAAGFLVAGGQQRDIATWARDQLSLSNDEAADLFYCDNDEVLDVLDRLIAKAEAEEAVEAKTIGDAA